MAYDRYDTRDEGSRWSEDRNRNRDWEGERSHGRDRHERGFFERAGDEIASWFGDGDSERRHPAERDRGEPRGQRRDFDRDRSSARERDRSDWGDKFRTSNRGGFSERDYNRDWNERSRDRDYRPMAGDYGRSSDHESEQFFAASGVGRGERGFGDYDRSQTPYARDEYRRTSSAASRQGSREFDPHYHNWRERHMSDLDRDYDDYRREHQSKFESDFGSWREKRQQKRGLLGQIREHMEVVGNDDSHVGTVDKVAGDRLILTKSDPESGGAHHSLSCSEIDKVEGDKVMLDCSADEARNRWRDESRSRALFEREDQGEMGPRNLNRSFEGTYR